MLEFLFTVLIVYLVYYLFMVKKYDYSLKDEKVTNKKDDILLRGRKSKKIKDNSTSKIPAEIELLIIKYRLDMEKINYRGLLKLVGLVCSIDIAIIVTIVTWIDANIYLRLFIGFILSIPTILISYTILGKFFEKKGLIRDDNERNRK